VGALACGIYVWRATQPFFLARPLLLAAVAWYGLFTVYCMFRVHRYAATQVNPVDVGVLDTLRFHRLQLERQRDFRRGIWRWQLPALLPGLVLQIAAMIVYSAPWQVFAFLIGVVSLGIALALAIGEYRARQSQREIDALDSLVEGS
jgi:hypothetical protein